MVDCIFCKIAKHQAEADIVYEDDMVIVFKDIKPSASIHLLIVSKKHIKSINQIKEEDKELMSRIIFIGKKMAAEQKIDKTGYNLLFNVGKGGGQIINHLHLHLLGGGDLHG